MQCPKCGSEESGKFCSRCGTELGGRAVGRKCAKCGTALEPGALFCADCGEPTGYRPSKGKTAYLPWVLSALALVAFAVALTLFIQGQQARLILPSVDVQATPVANQVAGLFAVYPRPLLINGTFYPYLSLYGDPAHMREVAASLSFTAAGLFPPVAQTPAAGVCVSISTVEAISVVGGLGRSNARVAPAIFSRSSSTSNW